MSPRRAVARGWILAAGLSLVASNLRAGEEYHSASHGFRMQVPDGWILHEEPNKAQGTLTARMTWSEDPNQSCYLRAAPLPQGMGAEVLRDGALKRLKGESQYERVEGFEETIAEQDAFGLRVVADAAGTLLRVEQVVWQAEGLLYVLEVRYPEDRHEALAGLVQAWKDSVQLEAPEEDPAAMARLQQLAGRCATTLPWAADWEAASKRARDSGRLVLVYARFMRGFSVTDEVRAGPLMDPDVQGLIQECFVPLAVTDWKAMPLRPREAYGTSASVLGTSFLLVTPDGDVVTDITTMETLTMDRMLREALARNPDWWPEVGEVENARQAATRALRLGRLEEARALVADDLSFEARGIRGATWRRQWQGERALEQLDIADFFDSSTEAFRFDVDQAVVLMRMGRFDAASDLLDRVVRRGPAQDRAQALYWTGALQRRAREEVTGWQECAKDHGDTPWGWRAAAALTATLQLAGDRLDWPTPTEYLVAAGSSADPWPGRRWAEAETEALEFLCGAQLDDGGFGCTTVVSRDRPDVPDDLSEAITAICGLALLDHSERPEAVAAAKRVVAALDASWHRAQAYGDFKFFMDYSVWSHSHALWFLAEARLAGVLDEASFRSRVARRVGALSKLQRKTGGWSYYVTGDLSSEAPDQSISFMTAASLVAFHRVQEAGGDVPEEMVTRALDALEAMGNEDGTHDYFLYEGGLGSDAPNPVPGAAGRAPACTLAEYLHGRARLPELRHALDLFLAHSAALQREQGKSLMHAGDHGQGSHYVLFDHAMAAAATAQLPANERGPYADALRDLLLACRNRDGSFVDNLLLGRMGGTGLALGALADLREEPLASDGRSAASWSGRVEVNGTGLSVTRVGKGEPVVFLHGGPLLDGGYFLPHVAPLARDFELVLFDQRLCGRSDAEVDPDSVSLDTFVADIEALRVALDLGDIHLVAHSFGGLLGMRYAAEHPRHLRSLVLLNSLPATSAGFQAEQQALMQRMTPEYQAQTAELRADPDVTARTPEGIQRMLRHSFRLQFHDPDKVSLLRLFVPEDYTDRATRYQAVGPELAEFDLRDALRGLTVPTLVLYGAYEPAADLGGKELAALIPGARFVTVPDAGHFPFVEQPERVLDLLRGFLR